MNSTTDHPTDITPDIMDMDRDSNPMDNSTTTMDTTCAPDSHLDTVVNSVLDISSSSVTDTTEDTQAALARALCNGKHTATECRTLHELGLSDRLGRVRALHLCL